MPSVSLLTRLSSHKNVVCQGRIKRNAGVILTLLLHTNPQVGDNDGRKSRTRFPEPLVYRVLFHTVANRPTTSMATEEGSGTGEGIWAMVLAICDS